MQLIKKKTGSLQTGDVVHFGNFIDVVQSVEIEPLPRLIARVNVFRRGVGRVWWNAGIDVLQDVRASDN